MKKTILALTLMLASLVTMQAQNLTRTAWSTFVPGDEELEMVLNFDDDGKCYIILTHEDFESMDDGTSITVRYSLSVPGIYNKSGREIIMSFNKNKADFDLSYDLNGADYETESLVRTVLEPQLKKMKAEAKAEYLDKVPSYVEDMRVISVSKHKLILGDDTGETLTFYPTAKG